MSTAASGVAGTTEVQRLPPPAEWLELQRCSVYRRQLSGWNYRGAVSTAAPDVVAFHSKLMACKIRELPAYVCLADNTTSLEPENNLFISIDSISCFAFL